MSNITKSQLLLLEKLKSAEPQRKYPLYRINNGKLEYKHYHTWDQTYFNEDQIVNVKANTNSLNSLEKMGYITILSIGGRYGDKVKINNHTFGINLEEDYSLIEVDGKKLWIEKSNKNSIINLLKKGL